MKKCGYRVNFVIVRRRKIRKLKRESVIARFYNNLNLALNLNKSLIEVVFIVRLTCRADPARSVLLGPNRYSRCVKNNKTSTSREVTPDTALVHHNNTGGTRKSTQGTHSPCVPRYIRCRPRGRAYRYVNGCVHILRFSPFDLSLNAHSLLLVILESRM